MTYVYALHDPRDKSVKYIGKTKNFDSRFRDHCKIDGSRPNRPKTLWMKDLRSIGLKPLCCILEVVEGDGDKEERQWIAHYRKLDIGLLNITSGGQHGQKTMPSHVRDALIKANTGKAHTEEHKKAIGEGVRLRWLRHGKPVLSPEARLKIANTLRGRKTGPCTEERRQAIREAKKARWLRLSQEERQKLLDRLRTPKVVARRSEIAKLGWIKRKLGTKNDSAEEIS